MTWAPEDYAILILASGIALALVLSVLTQWYLKQSYSEERAKSFAQVVATIIAIIALYIGAKVGGGVQ